MKTLATIATTLLAGLFLLNSANAQVPADAVWIDVRTAEEFAGGHIEGAHNIPYESIDKGVAALGLEQDTPILLYCRSGRRSGIALDSLRKQGYTQLKNVGGIEEASALAKQSGD